MVRAKFNLTHIREQRLCFSKDPRPQDGIEQKFLCFQTCYDDSIPEDERFQKATPSGSIEMQVDNPEALKQLEIGKSYYVDFTQVP